MVVLRDPGEAYLLRHTGGGDAISWVEQIDPESLEVVDRSPDLAGGPTWPGGMAVHAQRVALRRVRQPRAPARARHDPDRVALAPPRPSLQQLRGAARRSSRDEGLRRHASRWNRAVAGTGRAARRSSPSGSRSSPGSRSPNGRSRDSRRTATTSTSSVTRRCSASGGTATTSRSTTGSSRAYRTIDGQTYGWDAVIDAGAAWFLDNGAGSERYAGTFRGQGISTAPLHLVRVDLATGAVDAHRDLRAPERRGRQPAGGGPGAPDRRRLRQRQRRARRVLHRRRTARSHPAGPGSRTTRATWCASRTPASSSPGTTTGSAWPTRWWSSTSRPAPSSPGRTREPGAVGRLPVRRVRP